jgi:hypothetical protein
LRKRSLVFVFITSLTALVSYVATYSARVKLGDEPRWLTDWLLAHNAAIPFAVLVLSVITLLGESWRAYVEYRHPAKSALVRLLNDFAKTRFSDNLKRNRLTIFRATQGWRVWMNGTLRLLFSTSFNNRHKWRALFRVKPHLTYLTVYMRPLATRNVHSTVALRISDTTRKCEGVAGRIWDEGSALVPDLPHLDPDTVRGVKQLSDLSETDDIRRYAKATNLDNEDGLVIMKSMDHFARHFIGYAIKTSDGKHWGVLLLDSEEAVCPFGANKAGGELGKWMIDRARLFGSLLT